MRESYHDELDQIGATLVELTQYVATAMVSASTALLETDLDSAQAAIAGDHRIDDLRTGVEERCFMLLARQQPVAGDLRTITTALATAADLERMGDLAVHIAKVARMRYPSAAVPEEVRPSLEQMGLLAARLAVKVGEVIEGRDVPLARELEAEDDLMDALHRQLFSILLAETWSHGIEPAIDVTLLGRYYERFADHAVLVARRVIFLVTGAWPEELGAKVG
ncbi:MAG: phosphate signaling complex protein PhoU [Geodermatophilaceae bacterium]|nr:phosphate signaling complex protein PhoU [Geodermatophilaceae bacterium]